MIEFESNLYIEAKVEERVWGMGYVLMKDPWLGHSICVNSFCG